MGETLQLQKKPEISPAKIARAKRLGDYTSKWMMALLWLAIPNGIANTLTLNTTISEIDILYNVGIIIGFLCMGLEICFYLKLRSEEEEYFDCVKFGLPAIVLYGISEFVSRMDGLDMTIYWGAIALNCVAVVLFCIQIYHECNAHAMVLFSVDKGMTEKWFKLWKWLVIGRAGTLVGSLLLVYQLVDRVLLTVKIGLVLLPAMLLLSGIAGLFRMVYLEKSAKALREYARKITSQ